MAIRFGFGLFLALAITAVGSMFVDAGATSLGGRCSNWMSTSLANQNTGATDPVATRAACVALGKSGDFVTSYIERGATCLICAVSEWTKTTAAPPPSPQPASPENEANAALAALGITVPKGGLGSPTYFPGKCTARPYGYDQRPIYLTVPTRDGSRLCPGDGSIEKGWKLVFPNRDIKDTRWCALCPTPGTYWRSGSGCCVKK